MPLTGPQLTGFIAQSLPLTRATNCGARSEHAWAFRLTTTYRTRVLPTRCGRLLYRQDRRGRLSEAPVRAEMPPCTTAWEQGVSQFLRRHNSCPSE